MLHRLRRVDQQRAADPSLLQAVLRIRSVAPSGHVLPALGYVVTAEILFHPAAGPCEICEIRVADRWLDQLLICAGCAEVLAAPIPSFDPPASDEERAGAPLIEIIDKLTRSGQ